MTDRQVWIDYLQRLNDWTHQARDSGVPTAAYNFSYSDLGNLNDLELRVFALERYNTAQHDYLSHLQQVINQKRFSKESESGSDKYYAIKTLQDDDGNVHFSDYHNGKHMRFLRDGKQFYFEGYGDLITRVFGRQELRGFSDAYKDKLYWHDEDKGKKPTIH